MSDLHRWLQEALRWLQAREGWLVVLTLALGVGVASAFFALMDATVLRPVSAVQSAEDLVAVLPIQPDKPESGPWFSYADFRDYERLDVFSGLAAFRNLQLTVTQGEQAKVVDGTLASPNFFAVLGVKPELGSFSSFLQEEPRVVVLSHSLWQSWGADPDIIGQQIQISGTPVTITAVAAAGFVGIDQIYRQQFWASMLEYKQLTQNPWKEAGGTTDRRQPWLKLVGRKDPNVKLDQADEAVRLLAASLENEFPASNTGRSAEAVSLEELALGSGDRQKAIQYLQLLFGAALLVLLATCMNLGAVLLARAEQRKPEFAIRATLGASPLHLILQSMRTMAIIAAIGGAAALLLARILMPILEHLQLPNGVQPDLGLDLRVILFSLSLSMLVGLLVSSVSLQRAVRVQPIQLLGRDRRPGGNPFRFSVPDLLACLQITLCFLVVLATLFLFRTVRSLDQVDLGFDPGGILVAKTNIPSSGYSIQQTRELYRSLKERLVDLPQVQDVGLAAAVPILGLPPKVRLGIYLPGAYPSTGSPLGANQALVDTSFFDLLEFHLDRGRVFSSEDREGTLPAVVVNQTLAERAWPGESAVGEQLQLAPGTPALTVIGVVRDAKHEHPNEDREPALYVAFQQSEQSMIGQLLHDSVSLLVKTEEEPEAIVEPLQDALRSLDTNLVVLEAGSLPKKIRGFSRAERQTAFIFAGFGAVALALAMVGLYGAISRTVTRRWQELGIRAAMGATPSVLRRSILVRTVLLASIGLLLGVMAARPSSVILNDYLFGIGAVGPETYVTTALLILSLTLIIVLGPAWRASRVQPNRLLRED